jgi:CRP-like cAMP-binding protein
MTEVIVALATNPLLRDLHPDHLAVIADCSTEVAFDAGERLLSVGDDADAFWVIHAGRVDVEVHGAATGTIIIDRLEPGDVLGVSWIAEPFVAEFDATAVDSGDAVRVDAADLRGRCEADPRLGLAVHHLFATLLRDRLHHTRLRLLDLYGPTDDR